jgi:hypothetical protein
MPLLDDIAVNGDSGASYALVNPGSPQTVICKEFASLVVSEMAQAKFPPKSRPGIVYKNQDEHIIRVDEESFSPASLHKAADAQPV